MVESARPASRKEGSAFSREIPPATHSWGVQDVGACAREAGESGEFRALTNSRGAEVHGSTTAGSSFCNSG